MKQVEYLRKYEWEQITGGSADPLHWEWHDPETRARYTTVEAVQIQQWRNRRKLGYEA